MEEENVDYEPMDTREDDIIDIPELPEDEELPKVSSKIEAVDSEVAKDARIQRYEALLKSLETRNEERKDWSVESIILIGADNLHNKELKNVFEPTDVTIDRSIPRVLKVDFPDALYALESLVKITEPVIIVDRKAEAKNIQDIRVISRHRVPFDIPIGRYRLFKEEYTPIATEFLFCRFIVPSDLQKVHFISSEKATAEEEDDKETESSGTLKTLRISSHGSKRFSFNKSGLYSKSRGITKKSAPVDVDLRSKINRRRLERKKGGGLPAEIGALTRDVELNLLENSELLVKASVPKLDFTGLETDLRQSLSSMRSQRQEDLHNEMRKDLMAEQQLRVYQNHGDAYSKREKHSYEDLNLFD